MPAHHEPPDELRALSRLAFAELAEAVGGIGAVHRAIAGRAFAHAGPGARPAQVGHDAIAAGVYAAVAGALRLAGAGAARLVPRGELSATPRGALVVGVLDGLRGDALERAGSPLAAPMAVRVRGRPVPPERPALAAAFPHATPRLVVFLHGLMETEVSWRLGGRPTYGARLERDLGATSIEVRYNSGRHISENGRSLAALFEDVVAAWPVPVAEIALLGHSMGGLVARSACHRAAGADMAWVRRVRHVVALGSPHMGAPLEQAVHYAGAALHAVPEARPFAGLLRRRSAGIRDLRQGSLVDDDWQGRDPDALRAAACREVPLLEGATHCFVAATLTRSARHPVGRLLGDALVLEASACGRGRAWSIPFRPRTACTWVARTTSRCSTTRRSTSACATGSRRRRSAHDRRQRERRPAAAAADRLAAHAGADVDAAEGEDERPAPRRGDAPDDAGAAGRRDGDADPLAGHEPRAGHAERRGVAGEEDGAAGRGGSRVARRGRPRLGPGEGGGAGGEEDDEGDGGGEPHGRPMLAGAAGVRAGRYQVSTKRWPPRGSSAGAAASVAAMSPRVSAGSIPSSSSKSVAAFSALALASPRR